MNGLHFGIWLATAVVAILVLGISAAMSKSQSVKLGLCISLGVIWAAPCFVAFFHWLLSSTSFAFYTSASNRYPQTSGTRAFLALLLGLAVVYGVGSLARKPKSKLSTGQGLSPTGGSEAGPKQ